MKSLWARYRAELVGTEFIEYEWGFISFNHIFEDCTCIEDLWIEPVHRKTGLGRQLVKEVEAKAKENNKKLLVATIDLNKNGFPDNLKAALSDGFVAFKAEQDKIYIKKSVSVEGAL